MCKTYLKPAPGVLYMVATASGAATWRGHPARPSD